MQFVFPKFDAAKPPACVYQITFDNKWFYIGSTKNIKKRIIRWKSVLQTGRNLKSINIKKILHSESVIEFHILRVVKYEGVLRKKETSYIQTHWDNPLLLNRCPDGSTNAGCRHYMGYEKKIKQTGLQTAKKPIAQCDLDGNIIRRFDSIRQACLELKVKDTTIKHSMQGKQGPYKKKYIFKLIADDGSLIEPPKFVRKKPVYTKTRNNPQKGKFGVLNNCSKAVCMFDLTGNLIKEFGAVLEAARALQCKSQNIHAVLSGKRKTCKGYLWKYA